MLKLISVSRCSFCTVVEQKLSQNTCAPVVNSIDIQQTIDPFNKEVEKRKKPLMSKSENITAVKETLKKHNIVVDNLLRSDKIFTLTPWTVEKNILLLQELGVSTINPIHILNVYKGLFMTVQIFKANFSISPEVNLAEKMLSCLENYKVDSNEFPCSKENTIMKDLYDECMLYYVKEELDTNEEQFNRIKRKKRVSFIYNSFKLLKTTLRFSKNVLMFNNDFICRNRWLIGLHPGHTEAIYNMLVNNFENVTFELLMRSPKILQQDEKELECLLDTFKKFNVPRVNIPTNHYVFKLKFAEFQRRVEFLLSNPFTSVYAKHPRFLGLIKDYHMILPRIRYLEENNLKFASIHSLTTFHDYLQQLSVTRKVKIPYMISFFEFHFGKENVDKLMQEIRRHPYCTYIPLVQMLDSLQYLKKLFSMKDIQKHIYAILYNKTDIQHAYESVMSDPNYSELSSHKILPMCIYKIEEKYYFTLEGPLDSVQSKENLNKKFEQNLEDK